MSRDPDKHKKNLYICMSVCIFMHIVLFNIGRLVHLSFLGNLNLKQLTASFQDSFGELELKFGLSII